MTRRSLLGERRVVFSTLSLRSGRMSSANRTKLPRRALVVCPGRNMNAMQKPNVKGPLLHHVVDVEQAFLDTITYVTVLLENGCEVELLGVPLSGDFAHRVALESLAARFRDELRIHRHEEFSRWIHEVEGADAVFPEDWGRTARSFRDGSLWLVNSHMGCTERIGDHSVGLQTLLDLGLFDRNRIISDLTNCPDAKCESGDILQLTPDAQPVILIGLSERTTRVGFETWSKIAKQREFGAVYDIRVHPNVGLHLTTGAGELADDLVLFSPKLICEADLRKVPGLRLLEVHPDEQHLQNSGNTVRYPNDAIGIDERLKLTIGRIRELGYRVIPLPNLQHAAGAGGPSCRRLWLS